MCRYGVQNRQDAQAVVIFVDRIMPGACVMTRCTALHPLARPPVRPARTCHRRLAKAGRNVAPLQAVGRSLGRARELILRCQRCPPLLQQPARCQRSDAQQHRAAFKLWRRALPAAGCGHHHVPTSSGGALLPRRPCSGPGHCSRAQRRVCCRDYRGALAAPRAGQQKGSASCAD